MGIDDDGFGRGLASGGGGGCHYFVLFVMDRGALIAELDRLLDAGVSLLVLFPGKCSAGRQLDLPDHISEEMRAYAGYVGLRAWYREEYEDYRSWISYASFVRWVGVCAAGLVGWRALGVVR